MGCGTSNLHHDTQSGRKQRKVQNGSESTQEVIPEEECRLRIFHINDVYCLDNLPMLKSHIKGLSKNYDNTLSTLAGDFLAPSLLSSIDHGTGMVSCLNNVPIDLVCFGNHECDVPHESLKRRIDEFQGDWINRYD